MRNFDYAVAGKVADAFAADGTDVMAIAGGVPMTLLCGVKGCQRGWRVVLLERAEELARDDRFEAAFDLSESLALSQSSGDVGAGRGVDPAAGQDDGVQRPVELTIATSVEAVAVGQA